VQTRLEIARLHERLKSTMIYVTHDQVEAMTLADKIVVLRDGYIEQVGSPIELYERPANAFVAQFIGSPKMNFFYPADLTDDAQGHLPHPLPDGHHIGIRPEHLEACGASDAIIQGSLELVENLGEYVLAHLTTAQGTEFIAKMEKPPAVSKGSILSLCAKPELVHYFDATTGARISGA